MFRKEKIRKIIMEAAGYLLAFFLLSLLINLWRAPKQTQEKLPIALLGKTLDGIPAQQLLRKGQPFMIHFWGTWCPVCSQEASNIDFVAHRYPVLTVAVVSGSIEEIRQWMQKKGVSYPVRSDPSGALAKRFGVTTYPTTFIYDAKGSLKFVESGYTTTAGLLGRMKLAE